jgi:hypothetical protein
MARQAEDHRVKVEVHDRTNEGKVADGRGAETTGREAWEMIVRSGPDDKHRHWMDTGRHVKHHGQTSDGHMVLSITKNSRSNLLFISYHLLFLLGAILSRA